MREIKLPIRQTYISRSIDTNEIIKRKGNVNNNILHIDLSENSKTFEIIRKNGGNILYATTSIEGQLEEIISSYLFTNTNIYKERKFFSINELLASSDFTFKSKKEIVFKIINKIKVVSSKDKNKLQESLKRIMNWRNAFAHGNLQIEEERGPLIKYYSAGNRTLELSDNFWNDVELCYTTASTLLNKFCTYFKNEKA